VSERTFPTLDTHELAWAAGFFDGEGNIRAKPNKQWTCVYYHAVMSINQIDPQVLERFRLAVGGLGKVSGPYDRSRYSGAFSRQPQWTYEVFSFERVQAVTAMLWNWLSPVKREQARATFAQIRARPRPVARYCSVDACGKPHKAHGLCNTHYRRWFRANGEA
jgi:hypothetical protein